MRYFVNFDKSNGKTYHFHIYYRIITGKKFIKNSLLPYEKLFWKNLRLDKKFNIKVPTYEAELFFLITRILLKFDTVNKIIISRPTGVNKLMIPAIPLNIFL